jgi:hypothetical protein
MYVQIRRCEKNAGSRAGKANRAGLKSCGIAKKKHATKSPRYFYFFLDIRPSIYVGCLFGTTFLNIRFIL